jgi:RNA polymerase sigma factor (TIGR02999 family)
MADKTESMTRLLNAAASGDSDSASELIALIYDELRALARARMRHECPDGTLQATDLVHEAYMRLFGQEAATWNSRGHFFSAAAQAMRRILIEQARRKATLKRGGGREEVALDEADLAIEPPLGDLLMLDEVLAQLERTDPRKARLVLLHCFSGLTLEETAAALEISVPTAEREWRFARALLRRRFEDGGKNAE